jgi:hypothetical protein
MAVAFAALLVALSGTAVAAGFGPFNGNSIIKKNSLSGNRLKSHTVTGKQVNLSKLGTVPNANNAKTATIGSSPVAWAHVAANGTVISGRGIASNNIFPAGGGVYCLAKLGFSFQSAAVTADGKGNPGFVADFSLGDPTATGNCNILTVREGQANTQGMVVTSLGPTATPSSFFIQFFN